MSSLTSFTLLAFVSLVFSLVVLANVNSYFCVSDICLDVRAFLCSRIRDVHITVHPFRILVDSFLQKVADQYVRQGPPCRGALLGSYLLALRRRALR